MYLFFWLLLGQNKQIEDIMLDSLKSSLFYDIL